MLQGALPQSRNLYYGGQWLDPIDGTFSRITNPATGELLAMVANAGVGDVSAAVAAAKVGFMSWRDVLPLERGRILREAASVIRANSRELALLDAADSGNPFTEMLSDMNIAATQMDYFAGLVTEMKGASIPMGRDRINFSVREPLGVVARILAFNHPLMFAAGKSAAVLAAGNSVIIKPSEQAPLSALRLAELIGHLFPAGAFNVIAAARTGSAALAEHPDVASVGLIGSVGAGRAVMRSGSETLKRVMLELGGKNALIAHADADPDAVAAAVVAGMNFSWCGQSCGSTSRAFIHADIHDAVLDLIPGHIARFIPGIPTDPATTMGSIISREQHTRILDYIKSGSAEGARLLCGGGPPRNPGLAAGCFIEPTVFAGVTSQMKIAREEIFGPVLSVLRWQDEQQMIREVNDSPYGLTCAIWTRDLDRAFRTAQHVEAGFVWVNEVSRHFLGSPYGGYKQSGLGREECLAELLAYTQEKNIHVKLGR
ncbi:MAG: aldehyde dehydrogenase family protein [Steroidobacteraceae bacterium]